MLTGNFMVEGIPLRVEKVEKKSTHTLDFKNQ